MLYVGNHLRRSSRLAVDISYTLRVVGLILLYETLFLLPCIGVSLAYGEIRDVYSFLGTVGVMLCFGVSLLLLTGKHKTRQQGYREGALAVALTWFVLSLTGMLPFLFAGHFSSIPDAFFETVSGFTTTGFTAFGSVESLPKGILLWRSLIQWQGGIGIVVFTMALSPVFSGGGGLLYNAETSGIRHERFLPHIRDVAKRLGIIYVILTVVLIGLLYLCRMPLFDAVCHALSTICSGGFSSRDAGPGAFNSPIIEYILIVFMLISTLNLSLLYKVFTGKPKSLFRDEEFRWLLGILGCTIGVVFILLWVQGTFASPEKSFREAAFNVVSIASSTGYVKGHLDSWGPGFTALVLPVMFICGCAGSTTGGIKMSRFIVMVKNLRNEFKKRIHPNMVIGVRINGNSLPSNLVIQVLAFISLYLIIIIVGTMLIALNGHSLADSLLNVFSSISNIGYNFGSFGENLSSASGYEKLVLSLVMLAGRLEVFTFVAVLMPSFYKR